MPTIKFKLKNPKYCINVKKLIRCPLLHLYSNKFETTCECKHPKIKIEFEAANPNCIKRPKSCVDKFGK